jgi:predicted aspartyl protease
MMIFQNRVIGKNLVLFTISVLSVFLASFSYKVKTVPSKNIVFTDKTIWFPGSIIKSDAITGEIEFVAIPLKRIGNLVVIEARIDNETGNFIFDTGSSELVLNSTYFRKLFRIEEESGGITGSSGAVERTIVKNIQIPGLNFRNITANVSNLGHLENRRGIKILGLIGLSLFRNMEIIIDFDRNELYLFSLDKAGNRISTKDPGYKPDLVQKIEVFNNVLFVKVNIAGKILSFCLDTGAESNVINSHAPKDVLRSITILQRKNLMGVSKKESEVLLCSVNNLSLGNKPMPGMNAIVADLHELSAYYGYQIDGMLGFDFFIKGKVIINMKKKELKLCLNNPAGS